MKPLHTYFTAMLILAGCKGSPSPTASGPLNFYESVNSNKGGFSGESFSYDWSERLLSRKIHLSPEHPAYSDLKIRLISVGSDSTTTIRLDSGEQLTAKPGEHFVCSQFGTGGLELVSASPETGAAELQEMWSETTSHWSTNTPLQSTPTK